MVGSSSLGERLRRYRVTAGLTQEELAGRAGISARAVSDLERGISQMPRKDTLRLLADALGLTEGERATLSGPRLLAGAPLAAAHELAALPHGGYLGALPSGILVARDHECERIMCALDAVVSGEGRLLLLAGEPGVGKTRLAQEAMLLARARGVTVLVGRCHEEYVASPYLPFVDILTGAWAIASAALRQTARRRFSGAAWLLPALRGSLPARAEGDDPRLGVERAVAGFLTELAAERPLAILLDDLHWADHASLELLVHLAHTLRGAPVLLLGTYRDVDVDHRHSLATTLATLTRDRVVEVLVLHGLPPEGIAALLCARLGLESVCDELRDFVYARTEGNAFFAEEVLQALVEQRAIERIRDGRPCRELAALGVPETVRAAVAERVARLGAEAQDVLTVASVLGQEFELDVLLGAAEQVEEVVLEQVEAALAMRLLEERPLGRDERYAFVHALVAQTLYDAVPRFRLRRLHLRAGEALERVHGENPEVAAQLSRHFLRAGENRRAGRYALVAGDHALELYAAEEAASQYAQALELLLEEGDEAGVAEVRRKLGSALQDLNRREEALATYDLALAAFERLGDRVGQALVHRDIAWVYQWHDDFAAARPHLEAALALWPAERTNGELTHLLLDAARARRAAGDTKEATALAGRGLTLAEQMDNAQLRARALLELALVRIAAGTKVQALIALLDEAEGVAREAGDLRTLGRICSHRADARRLAGDARGAYADCRQSLDLALQSGLRSAAVTPCIALAALCCRLGEWAEGRALLRRAHETDPQVRPHDVAVWLALLQGDRDALHTALQEALGDDLRGGDVGRVRAWLAWLWRLALWEGQLKEAERLVQQWLELAPPAWDPGIAVAAEVLVRRYSPEASATLAAAERAMTETGAALMRSGVLRAQGLLAWQSGDLDRAVEALRESATAARAHGELLELGSSLSILTTAAQELGETGLARAADAERIAIVAQIGPELCRLGWLWANPT